MDLTETVHQCPLRDRYYHAMTTKMKHLNIKETILNSEAIGRSKNTTMQSDESHLSKDPRHFELVAGGPLMILNAR